MMDVHSRVQQTIADAEVVFPGAREQFEAARVKSWSEDPWQRGGLTSFGPGELNWIPVNARREGRIFFAGEHTGDAGQVTNTVAIRVLEGARINLVDDGFLPLPGFVAVVELLSWDGGGTRQEGGSDKSTNNPGPEHAGN